MEEDEAAFELLIKFLFLKRRIKRIKRRTVGAPSQFLKIRIQFFKVFSLLKFFILISL